MKPERQRHRLAFKAEVGMEVLAGAMTVAEIAREHQVHPAQTGWAAADIQPD